MGQTKICDTHALIADALESAAKKLRAPVPKQDDAGHADRKSYPALQTATGMAIAHSQVAYHAYKDAVQLEDSIRMLWNASERPRIDPKTGVPMCGCGRKLILKGDSEGVGYWIECEGNEERECTLTIGAETKFQGLFEDPEDAIDAAYKSMGVTRK